MVVCYRPTNLKEEQSDFLSQLGIVVKQGNVFIIR